MQKEESDIVAKECRFAFHIPSKSYDVPDIHVVKEILHLKDGTTKPNLRIVKDMKRPFWVTKKPYQNHQQKKESEKLENLVMYQSTQSNLRFNVAKALGKPSSPLPINELAASPYLYGSDISSTAIIKYEYMKAYPDAVTPYNVAFLDIETDMVHGTDDPIMITVVYNGVIYFSVVVDFLKGYSDIEARYRAAVDKYIKEYIDKNNFKIEFHLATDCVDMLKWAFSKLHQTMPDFVAVWNIGFDVVRIMETLEKYGVDPADVFCDPRIPKELRYCKYKKGSTKKITASGQVKPKKPSEQWHSLLAPASFWFIDQMSSYRFVRQGAQELGEYSLDFVLNEELGIRKLKFEEANAYHKGAWHTFMQQNYPFEYCVYNNFDSIGTFELEKKTRDLSTSVPVRTNISDFSRFDSQTKRFADKYHYFLLQRGEVIGTVPPSDKNKKTDFVQGSDEEADYIGEFESDDDELTEDEINENFIEQNNEVLSLKNWIVTLKSHLSSLGLPILEETDLNTQIRTHSYDSDAVSAYPTCAAVSNVSLATTLTEIIAIQGVDEAIFRQQNINLLQGHVNALEYSSKMFNLPKLQESLSLFADMA